MKVFDYGCSWGYEALQLERAGFDAQGYEISMPLIHFAVKKLGIHLIEPAHVDSECFDFV